VRCAIDVPAGSFVCEYAGTVITDAEAEACREREDGDMYLFELDGAAQASGDQRREQESPLCIDAGPCGNVGRFVNHSCEPNLFVQCVHVTRHDLRWPVLCLFALRDIPAGEELTYDYNYVNERAGLDTNDELAPRTRCTCGAATCRTWLYG